MASRSGYLPVSEHGLIGDLHTVARVGTNGTIDWPCSPSLDAPSVFGSILDPDGGGCFELAAAVPAKTYVRIQVLTNWGALDRAKQLQVERSRGSAGRVAGG
jgi:GH15 family glucan-1,4-alpha-glucosidase